VRRIPSGARHARRTRAGRACQHGEVRARECVRTVRSRCLVKACEQLERRRDVFRGAVDDLVRLEDERLEGGRAAGERPRNRRPQREDDFDPRSRRSLSQKGVLCLLARPGLGPMVRRPGLRGPEWRLRTASACAGLRQCNRWRAPLLSSRSHPSPDSPAQPTSPLTRRRDEKRHRESETQVVQPQG
jgi:hypothetical protein